MSIKTKLNIDTTKLFIASLLSFAIIQVMLWILSELDIIPLIQIGWVFLLAVAIVGIVSLFVLGKKIGTLDLKRDGPFILVIFVSIIALFIWLPNLVPQIFSSTALEMGDYFKELVATISRLGPGGIIK